MFDLQSYIGAQRHWSARTFGLGARSEGICKHIEKELCEIRSAPEDLMEWVDVIILALDGAWRAGYAPSQIVAALQMKQEINQGREWPAPGPEDEPTEHVR